MKRLIFSLIFLVALVLIVLFYNKETSTAVSGFSAKSGKASNNSVVNDGQTEDRLEVVQVISDECEDYMKNLSNTKFENLENRRWSNYHIKYTDGEIYRIRYFYDDGPNGEYKKTVLYKEDETEFPLIVKTYRGFEKEELKDYFDNGEIIWQEQAYETILDEKSVYWRKINDEFVDLNIDEGLSCL